MHKKEPLFHMAKRDKISRLGAYAIRVAGVLVGLIISAIVIYGIVKINPIEVYVSMWDGNFGNSGRTWFMIRDTMILTCISIGLAAAFKMKFWNIGAEGQMLLGAIATAFFMINFPDMHPVLLFVCMIISSVIAGAVWGLIPGFFKAKINANETLFTLMMNYIAIQLTSFCVSKWENPVGSNTVGTINSKTHAGWIGNFFNTGYNGDFFWTVLIVIAMCALMYIYLKSTKQGFEIAVVGDSQNTAAYSGIRVNRVFIRTMAISGAVCGFSGFLAVSAVSHTISTSTAGGRGFTAIIVAWLAKMNPFFMILIATLLTFLDKGAIQIASDFGLNEYASQIVSGIMLLCILGSEFFVNYELHGRKKNKEVAA